MQQVLVWVEDWEMQCCGTPFKTGDRVNWEVSNWEDEPCCRPDLGIVIDLYYENHPRTQVPVRPISGVVAEIKAGYRGYEPDASGRYMIATTSQFVDFNGLADGWEDDIGEGNKFAGYLVRLNVFGRFDLPSRTTETDQS